MGLIKFISKLTLGSKFRQAMSEIEKMKKNDPELEKGLANLDANYKVINKLRNNLKSTNNLISHDNSTNTELNELIRHIPTNLTDIQWNKWRNNFSLPVRIKLNCVALNITRGSLMARVGKEIIHIEVSNEFNNDSLIEINRGSKIEITVDLFDIWNREPMKGGLRFRLIEIIRVSK